MSRYEYKVVPAPTKGLKAPGIKTPEARFSHAIEALMNSMAEEDWDYVRAETLPSTERSGLTSSITEWRNVLVFRRLHQTDAETFGQELLPAPDLTTPAPLSEDTPAEQPDAESPPVPPLAATGATVTAEKPQSDPAKDDRAFDNGVEGTRDIDAVGSPLSNLAAYRSGPKTDA